MAVTQLGEWLPDRGEIGNPGILECENMLPLADGYRTIADFVADPNRSALDAACQGAFSARTQGGVSYTTAGTATKLWKLLGTDWEDASNGTYAVPSDGRWSFAQWRGFCIATNGVDQPQYLDLDGAAADYANLSPHASFAAIVFVHREFTILGDIDGRGDNVGIQRQEAGLHWSAFSNPLSWPQVGTDAAQDVQSDYEVLPGAGGPVTAGVSVGEYALVFRERQVWRMDYVGGTTVWAFRKLDDRRGCILRDAAISVGGITYFPSEDGWMACDGARIIPIGHEKVDRTWRYLQNWDRTTVTPVVRDPRRRAILWGLCTGVSTYPNMILGYRYDLQRWFQILRDVEWLFTLEPLGENLEAPPYDTMDLEVNSPTGLADVDLDTLGKVVGGELGAFDLAHRVGTFTSDTGIIGVLGTGDIDAGARIMLRGMRLKYRSNADWQGSARTSLRRKGPIGTGSGSSLLQVGVSARLGVDDTITYSYQANPNRYGVVPLREAGRYFRARIFINDRCDYVQGYEPIMASVELGSR